MNYNNKKVQNRDEEEQQLEREIEEINVSCIN